MKLLMRQASPPWLGPSVAALAVGFGLLTAVFHSRPCDSCPGVAPELRLGLIAVVVVAWLVETSGVWWLRPLFILLALVPSSALIVIGSVEVGPLLVALLVAWIAYTSGPRLSGVTLLLGLASLVPAMIVRGTSPWPWLPWLLGIGFSWIGASLLAAQQRLLAELRIAQASLADQAAMEERRRIARELHDVIAHSLAVTMLHLTGARHILARDPKRAAEALAEAERMGRQSLADIRRTVGLLQADRPDGAAAPLPTASEIPSLVEGYRRAGLEVQLEIIGDPSRLSSATGLGLYRITQEALANVVKHAPGAKAEVHLLIGAGTVKLSVTNTPRREGAPAVSSAGGSGLGLVGMRERAALLGGTLIVQPSGGGWQVECTLPV